MHMCVYVSSCALCYSVLQCVVYVSSCCILVRALVCAIDRFAYVRVCEFARPVLQRVAVYCIYVCIYMYVYIYICTKLLYVSSCVRLQN